MFKTIVLVALVACGQTQNARFSRAKYQPPPPVEATPWHLARLSSGNQWQAKFSGNMYPHGGWPPAQNQEITYDQLDAKRPTHVFLLDTGVDSSCPSFEGRVQKGESFEPSKDRSPDGTSNDLHGRGTFIAGLITSRDFGVSNATVVGVKVADRLGSATTESILAGVNYALEEIKKSSLEKVATICIPDPMVTKPDYVDLAKLNDLITGNPTIPFVLSAGNFPSSVKFEQANAIVVGATNNTDGIWSMTNKESAKYYAPGVNVKSNTAFAIDRDHRPTIRTGSEVAAGIVCGLSSYFQALDLNDEPVWKVIEKFSLTANIAAPYKIVQNRF